MKLFRVLTNIVTFLLMPLWCLPAAFKGMIDSPRDRENFLRGDRFWWDTF